MTAQSQSPRRGEIWTISLDPTVGSEIRKTRPALVVSSDAMGRLPIRIVVPITEWSEAYARDIWHIRIEPAPYNGLYKSSAADAMQLRCVDRQRFVAKLGRISATLLEEVVAAIAAIVEYQ